MAHKLVLIAVLGLGVSAVCVGAGAAIGGRPFGDGLFDHRPRCELLAGATTAARDLDWDGSDHAALNLAGQASYTPGTADKLHASGDPQVLAHLRVRDGTVELDCRGWRDRTKDLAITLPGRPFEKFSLAGEGKINLNRLDQPNLKIELAGIGTITANGKVDDLKIEIAGVAKADFGQVTGRKVKLEMAGVSRADIAPSDEADIEMAGPSEVTLHSNPKRMETEIAGPGRIHRAAPAT
jgi:hypothetical protein